MNKKGSKFFWVSIALVVFFVAFLFLYLALFKPEGGQIINARVVENPVVGLSDAQAVSKFDEDFVFYLIYNLEAYNLHNPPLSSNYPKIEVAVDNVIYNVLVIKGAIKVNLGAIKNEDLTIKTTKMEAVKMLRDSNYVKQSFNDKKSSIELVAGKLTLFSKGYLNLYNNIIGKSVTGNLIRIATD